MILSPMFTEYLISFNDNIPLPHRAFVWSFVNISIVGKYQHILRNLEKENREKKKNQDSLGSMDLTNIPFKTTVLIK